MGRKACTEPQCLYKGALYLYLTVQLYLYSPYGPYGLYRASVPVQGCTLPCFYFLFWVIPRRLNSEARESNKTKEYNIHNTSKFWKKKNKYIVLHERVELVFQMMFTMQNLREGNMCIQLF